MQKYAEDLRLRPTLRDSTSMRLLRILDSLLRLRCYSEPMLRWCPTVLPFAESLVKRRVCCAGFFHRSHSVTLEPQHFKPRRNHPQIIHVCQTVYVETRAWGSASINLANPESLASGSWGPPASRTAANQATVQQHDIRRTFTVILR